MSKQSDHDLEQYLKGDSKLSQLYHSTSKDIEPPTHLDKLILKSAKSEVSGSTFKSWVHRWFGNDWLTPATSTIMVVLMVLGVYLLVMPPQNGVDVAKSPSYAPSQDTKDKTVPVKNSTEKSVPSQSTIEPAPSYEKGSYDRKSPESWLNHIKNLYDHQKSDVARVEFIKFRKRYPDYNAKAQIGKHPSRSLDPVWIEKQQSIMKSKSIRSKEEPVKK